ncbi:MAG: NAD(P)/FAD-dependent oxidoreductase [Gammaproteobacteria bacterium]|uniref:NAD(P)/FAD-dependent oxidoreductase n=1 Tax=Rhodoferax sp. TaxID=50421 RepID=UPI0017BBD3D3|nr:NAD(P)/FAD-dependent oxidoreductase [Rhodoferax sp.]MBU3898902.1 NAD(P)/FAD-dependent oxidoreductase [Gammaproteobacteria bacterium]MBA3059523.1 NAD(P)/FAD-dependent oxidoreductase [Rhodoferax sp.]MBU3999093.1 NAD(P)/FAD-dependent oxidoreductase [Gammaproteobacteria bacterium]MBU4019378.1 NAD(P)/FAD-dependent oxidoreductase [Gammaproteobacteria bacterium]MBU4081942.1 NAD(P)/FAD-dependent oxidoreductase [Gammaproteobacteria bacterium]
MRVDCVVIGAGVVGLAVARQLAQAGREVIVLEAAQGIGTGTSSRNSEVIHAGIYDASNSLKARLCVQGRQALYAYCERHAIAHRRCGKLIVATDAAQAQALQALHDKARANGVADLQFLSAAQVRALEPDLVCVAALLSPSTGIIDSHAFMLQLQADAEQAGAVFAFHSAVQGGKITTEGIALQVQGANEPLLARHMVNCAGLQAQQVAASLVGLAARNIPPLFYAKGNYFSFSGPAHFSHLVYPMPQAGGLGIHLTLDLAGRPRFGPDVQWVSSLDYSVDAGRKGAFQDQIRRYWPGVDAGSLQPDYAGIRPKLVAAGAPGADFQIDDQTQHGVAGLVNLFGIESPGLTAALAISDHVLRRL